MKMKVSVIVPYWNASNWIGRCCESLTRQTGDLEFIMVDDNSTDTSAAIVSEYKRTDARFIMLRNGLHGKGVSGARNTGIEYADGEWITFLDADDEMLDDAYWCFVDAVEMDKRANIHQFNHMRYYTSINKLTMKYTNNEGSYTSKKLPNVWFGVWNKLFRREFLEGLSFDESLQYGEDVLFVLECLAKDNYIHHAHLNTTTVKHRFDNRESLSHTKKEEDLLKYTDALEQFIRNHEEPAMKQVGCKVLSDCWGSPTYLKIIGKEEQ